MKILGEERERDDVFYLLVPELDQTGLVDDDLIPLVLAVLEQLRQREPLPGHLVAVVGVHELIVIDAIGGVALHALDGGLAAVERDDVVDEGLAGWRELERFGWVGGVVFHGVGLADLELLAGDGGVFGEVRHLAWEGGETGDTRLAECGAGDGFACWIDGAAGCSKAGIDHEPE